MNRLLLGTVDGFQKPVAPVPNTCHTLGLTLGSEYWWAILFVEKLPSLKDNASQAVLM